MSGSAKQSRIFPRRDSGLLRRIGAKLLRNFCRELLALTEQGASSTSANFLADTPSPSRGACRPGFASRPPSKKARAQGKPGAGWHPRSVRDRNAHGVDHRCAGRPAFPARMVLTVSFVLSSGSVALLPPSPCGWLMRASGRTCSIPARLDAQTPGVGTTRLLRPRTSSLGIRGVACARPRSHAKTLSAPCRLRESHCSRCPALQCQLRPTPSRPSLPSPRFVTIAIRPSSRAGVCRLYDKSEFR